MSEKITTLAKFIEHLKELEEVALKYSSNTTGPNSNYYLNLTGFVRRNIYSGLKWFVSAGPVNAAFVSHVENNYPHLAKFFNDEDSEGVRFLDPSGNVVDGIHLIGTLSSRDCMLFGFIADVISNAKNISKWKKRNKIKLKEITNEYKYKDKINQKISDIIMGDREYNCSMSDIISDIDAIFINKYIKNGVSLSNAFSTYYYGKRYMNRFDNFAKLFSTTDYKQFRKEVDNKINYFRTLDMFDRIEHYLANGVDEKNIEQTIISFCKLVAINTSYHKLYRLGEKKRSHYEYGDKYKSYISDSSNDSKKTAQEILIDRSMIARSIGSHTQSYFKFKIDNDEIRTILRIRCERLSTDNGLNFSICKEDKHGQLENIWPNEVLDGTEEKIYILEAVKGVNYYISTLAVGDSEIFRISITDYQDISQIYKFNCINFKGGFSIANKEVDVNASMLEEDDKHEYILQSSESGYKRLMFWTDKDTKINIQVYDYNNKEIIDEIIKYHEGMEKDVYFSSNKPYRVKISCIRKTYNQYREAIYSFTAEKVKK